MRLIRAATLTVSSLEGSKSLYCDWLDYQCVEQGFISKELAASWDAPKTTGQPYVVLQPASGAQVYIRMISSRPFRAMKPCAAMGGPRSKFAIKIRLR